MGARSYEAFVEQVKASADIVRIIGETVALRGSGKRLKALCPFHDEKTPSFHVDADKQLFYCFGCGVGGDAIRFVMLHDDVDFREAIRRLGEQLGIPEPVAGDRKTHAGLLEINRFAAEFFRRALAHEKVGARARAYLERRGFDAVRSERHGLGYAPPGFGELRSRLLREGFAQSLVERSGLVVVRDGRRPYDRFRDRLVFPIEGRGGSVLAFGGRLLSGEGPKYLNSPETPVFQKGSTLYKFHCAADAMRRAGFALLVEGYFDVLALHDAGFETAVAPLGTALTGAQAALLARNAREVVLCFDGDDAGRRAARRSLEVLLEQELEVRVLELPAGEDPDSVVRERGAEAFREHLDARQHPVDFLVETVLAGRSSADAAVQVEVLQELLPLLRRMPGAVKRGSWVSRVANRLGIDDSVVLSELRRTAENRSGQVARAVTERLRPEATVAEQELVRTLAHDPGAVLAACVDLEEEDVDWPVLRRLLGAARGLAARGGLSADSLLAEVEAETELREALLRSSFVQAPPLQALDLAQCVVAIRLKRLRKQREALQRRMERGGDAERVGAMLTEIMEISRRVDELS